MTRKSRKDLMKLFRDGRTMKARVREHIEVELKKGWMERWTLERA